MVSYVLFQLSKAEFQALVGLDKAEAESFVPALYAGMCKQGTKIIIEVCIGKLSKNIALLLARYGQLLIRVINFFNLSQRTPALRFIGS
ncbi:hypothetical protein LSCM4_02318 [Leishmania orientalis]|uniref:Uncharacterized protein n=1 Tax=Leishmania orientalis TaxID=2249476 RepID=A0A836H153_9TRYP|nr:hypothetical protein LSCM4_02318 [Leishmania orientalis]